MNIAQEMLTTFTDDTDLLKKIITGDESWVHGYDIETKAKSSQCKAFCYDCGDKRKIETGAIGNTKKRDSDVYRGLEITLALVYHIWVGLIWRTQDG